MGALRRLPNHRATGQSGLTLIELLIGLIIGTIITTMILLSWFALNKSFSFAVNSNIARDNARQVIMRMERELRDTQQPVQITEAGIYRARPYWCSFFTTFNVAGNTSTTPSPSPTSPGAYTLAPRLVLYRLYYDPATSGQPAGYSLWRFSDVNNNGSIANVNLSPFPDDPTGFNRNEETSGEGAMLLTRAIVNFTQPTRVPMFQYGYFDENGHLQYDTSRYGTDNRLGIVAVQIRLLEDLNPISAPLYVDLVTTAQIRNQR
jgi:type II secretory pathway pseudopilin PulG